MKHRLTKKCDDIASLENLLLSWEEFLAGKKSKPDVQDFKLHLMEEIISLRNDIVNGAYRHGGYKAFNISDPKPRNIHKAVVRDRLLHHAIYRVLYPFFDTTFVTDSYSCRIGKGTHKALERFDIFCHKVGRNNTRTVWVLKCDIRKFFASIDHTVLFEILSKYIVDSEVMDLLWEIIESFSSTRDGIGLPLGNLTSQLFVNIYMNEFDQFVKHVLKEKYYIRYADDFVILSESKIWLERLLPKIRTFLGERLRLDLHPRKVSIKTLASGIDFLGWVMFSDHKVLRTATKRRMVKRLANIISSGTVSSYRGLLKHGNAHKLTERFLPANDKLTDRLDVW
jgi:retron-type reverse transcriptase